MSFAEIPSHALILLPLALVAGMARGFSGFGAALIFVPVAARFIGPQQASPVLLITDAIVAAPLIWKMWPQARKPEVALMALGGFVGVPLGTYILKSGDALVLRWLIAGLTTTMLVLLLSGWRYRGRPHKLLTILVGSVSGLFSGIAQIGGPPVVAYWLGGDTKAAVMRASTFLYFAIGSATTMVSYGVCGLLTGTVFSISVMVLPFFALGLWIGNHMFGFASEMFFRRSCLLLIAVSLVASLPLWG
jgi:uncharacterized protein